MYSTVFIGMAFGCAGALCALVGDIKNRPTLGMVSFLVVNLTTWGLFLAEIFSTQGLAFAALHFMLSQAASTLAYLGMVFFLDRPVEAAASSEDDAHGPGRTVKRRLSLPW